MKFSDRGGCIGGTIKGAAGLDQRHLHSPRTPVTTHQRNGPPETRGSLCLEYVLTVFHCFPGETVGRPLARIDFRRYTPAHRRNQAEVNNEATAMNAADMLDIIDNVNDQLDEIRNISWDELANDATPVSDTILAGHGEAMTRRQSFEIVS